MTDTRRLNALIFPVCFAALMNVAVLGFASGETEAAAAEPVTLKMTSWISQSVDTYENHIVGPFNEAHPGIEIEYEMFPWSTYWQKLQTLFASGDEPDILEMAADYKGAFVANGHLLDLTPFLERGDIDKDDFFEESWNRGYVAGADGFYGMYSMVGTGVLMYNKDIFDDAGIPYPDSTWDYDKLLEVAKELTVDEDGDGTPDQWGIVAGGHYWNHALIQSFGGTILTEDFSESNLLSPGSLAGLQYDSDLIHKHGVAPTPEMADGLGELFFTGKVALRPNSAYNIQRFREIEDFRWDIALLPEGPEGRKITLAGDPAHSISANTEHPEEAWAFFKWYYNNLSVDNLILGGNFTGNKALADVWTADQEGMTPHNIGVVQETVEVYGARPPYWDVGIRTLPEIRRAVSDMIRSYRGGHVTVEEAAAEATATINEALSR